MPPGHIAPRRVIGSASHPLATPLFLNIEVSVASLFATAPIDAGPNSKCGIFRVYFLSFFIFASILVARSWPATVSALSGPHCPRPLLSDNVAPH